jgi:hypothetical protein
LRQGLEDSQLTIGNVAYATSSIRKAEKAQIRHDLEWLFDSTRL